MIKKWFHILMFLLVVSLSCDSTEQAMESSVVTCDDGVMNGDETGVDCGGSCNINCLSGNTLEGVVVSVIELTSGEEHTLTGPLLIRDGGELIIQAGTTIKAQKGNDVYIAIAQGGKLFAYGREDAPIVITSAEENPQPGDWGGIVICGDAPINSGLVSRSGLLDLFYGGEDADDSSGFIRYLRVEYAGAEYNDTSNFSGITFYGVGRFTTFNNVQSYNSLGNGFNIVGGTVAPENLVAIGSAESAFKVGEGWNGVGNRWYASNFLTAGLELGNNNEDVSALPTSSGILREISLLGPSQQGAIVLNDGGGLFQIEETFTTSFDLGIQIDGLEASNLVDDGAFNITNIEFSDIGPNFVPTNYNGSNTTFYTENTTLGAGNKDLAPDWAQQWATGF